MLPDIAIEAQGLAKAYKVYARPADRLRQAVMPRAARLLGPLRGGRGSRPYFTEHWALRPLSFTIRRGETMAIIGRNGSGKSTLLQLICGTLTPSEGDVRVQGRVAALLELGSGFNPEYTGIENVFLNASVLGLSREEIEARLTDILAFADIGEFVHQPVKTYSSGMVTRLAFAVIAHVEADVLVIDEALSVGDAYFQQKCMRWLRSFQSRGTVLFCGHDISAVTSLCDHAIWLDRSHFRMEGPAKEVAEAYNSFIAAEVMGLPPEAVRLVPRAVAKAPPLAAAEGWRPVPEAAEFGSDDARITHLRLTDAAGREPALLEGGEALLLEYRIEARRAVPDLLLGFTVKDRLGQAVLGANTADQPALPRLAAGSVGHGRLAFALPHLNGGPYVLAVAIASGRQASHVTHHWVHEAMVLNVHNPRHLGTSLVVPLTEGSLSAEDPLTR